MNITLDIDTARSAVIWQISVLVILLDYRSKILILGEGLASRVKKIEVAGVSLELALAKPFVPEWSGAPKALDLRHKAMAIQVKTAQQGCPSCSWMNELKPIVHLLKAEEHWTIVSLPMKWM